MTSSALPGKLIVFEGPDGAGKTSLSKMLHSYLTGKGIPTSLFSFPGKDSSELGTLVYNFHHLAIRNEVQVDKFSLQLLHVAAHIDLLNNYILPDLKRGICVILDRFWWSVVVYGLHANVSHSHIKSLICIERLFWKGLRPDIIFLLERECDNDEVCLLMQSYMKIYPEESVHGNAHLLYNKSIDETFDAVLNTLHERKIFNDSQKTAYF